jgi:hypothetical protein
LAAVEPMKRPNQKKLCTFLVFKRMPHTALSNQAYARDNFCSCLMCTSLVCTSCFNHDSYLVCSLTWSIIQKHCLAELITFYIICLHATVYVLIKRMAIITYLGFATFTWKQALLLLPHIVVLYFILHPFDSTCSAHLLMKYITEYELSCIMYLLRFGFMAF